MPEKVILVFDIGKTMKKFLLFDRQMKVVLEEEKSFATIKDEDGFECDDLNMISNWIFDVLSSLLTDNRFDISGINFSAYGASIVYLDEDGNPLAPLYNYLKPMPDEVADRIYNRYGGKEEFCRNTASPGLGMLNSGLQILQLKTSRPEVFASVKHILHFPQYLSFLLTGKVVSEHTSIGCHTAMWNFDEMVYHEWLADEGISLPEPVPVVSVEKDIFTGNSIPVGTGIHDSSASLVPFFESSEDKFLLLSTGTWSIAMNPFNTDRLSAEQLRQDCLCYMSIRQEPVMSSRFFLGHIHDVNTKLITEHFSVETDSYKEIDPSAELINSFFDKGIESRVFFRNGIPEDYLDNDVDLSIFNTFSEAYHRLMFDLTYECVKSIKLVLPENSDVGKIYVSGGFTNNRIFMKLMAGFFPDKRIFTAEVKNSSALGAALVTGKTTEDVSAPSITDGLKEWEAF